jgi:hypothetical protein
VVPILMKSSWRSVPAVIDIDAAGGWEGMIGALLGAATPTGGLAPGAGAGAGRGTATDAADVRLEGRARKTARR